MYMAQKTHLQGHWLMSMEKTMLPMWLETLRIAMRSSKSQHSLLKSGFRTLSGFAYITYLGWWPMFLTTNSPWYVGFLFGWNYGARDRSRSLLKMLATFYSGQKHYLCLRVTDLNVSLMTQNGARSRYLLPKFCTCFSPFLVKYLLSVWIGKGYFTPKANGDGFGRCLFVLFWGFIFLRNAQWVEVLSMLPPNGLFIKVPPGSIGLFCLFHRFMEALFAHL